MHCQGGGGRRQCQQRLRSLGSHEMGGLAVTMPYRDSSLHLLGPPRAESVSLVNRDVLAAQAACPMPRALLLPAVPAACLAIIKDPTTFAGCLRRCNK